MNFKLVIGLFLLYSCTKSTSVTPPQVNVQIPVSPTGLLSKLSSPTSVSLTWNDQSTNELGFKIERKVDGGNYILLATVGTNVTSYQDVNLSLNSSYTYRVNAYNSAGNSSGYSNSINIIGQRNGLLAFYPFNGNASDESGNGNNGLVNGAILDSDRFGNQLSSYLFNGTNYITISNKNLISNGAFSISCWIKLGTLFANNFDNTIIGQWSSNGDQKFLLSFREQNSYRGIGFYLNNGATQFSYYNTNWIPSLTNWYHIVAVYSPGNFVETYLNGHLFYSSTINKIPSPASTFNPLNTPIQIGFSTTLNRLLYFVGNIDDIKIYNRELSIYEISYLYTN
jgi:hypothetical protein